jgi:CO/xanthine dehydrogenase FAD-binding subunit
MEKFAYVRAESAAHAVMLLNEPGVRSRVLAGGTDLLLLLRHEPQLCDQVVDISLVLELHRIEQVDGQVTIGAAATFHEVMDHPLVRATAPVLAQACRLVGATQIRNMGTLGGNVANAAACADSIPALVCMDAVATVLTPDGVRQWPVAELVLRPNRTLIPPGGLLASFQYKTPLPGSQSVFLKLGRRNAMAISRLTVAALGRLDARGCIAEARLAPGSATPQIQRFHVVEDSLLGETPSKALCLEAGRQAVAEMRRITGQRWSSEYKEPALQSMVANALMQVFGLGRNLEERAL